jgi:alkaline phosphatase D
MLADDRAAPESEQIQFVLHLGDFIYERSWNVREDGSEQSRRVPDFPDGIISRHHRHAVSLADYRHLYKTYLNDPHLQEARARWPFISIWDDHEFSNDNFQSYTTYGDAITLEARRKLNANQAWFEYVPAVLSDIIEQPAHDFRDSDLVGKNLTDNAAAQNSLCIYRMLNWGRHLDIVLTDTRSYRSAPCLPEHIAEDLGLPLNTVKLVEIADSGNRYNEGNPPEFLPYGDGRTANPGKSREPGSALGPDQRDWFLRTVQDSSATWKLWGNALPLMPMRIDLSALPMSDYEDSVISIDAWSGYPYEVNLLMTRLRDNKISGVVSLSGDHHLHGASTISWSTSDPDAKPVAADFACAGISSTPFFESIVAHAKRQGPEFADMVYRSENGELVPVWHMTMLRGVLASFAYAKTGFESIAKWLGPNEANPGLKYMDCNSNGYGLAQFRADQMQVQLITMENLRQPFDTAPEIRHKAIFQMASWSGQEQPVLNGPTFEGDAPFPFEV